MNDDKNYTIEDGILCWKVRIYVPQQMRRKVMKLEHDSKVAGHFGRDSTLYLIRTTIIGRK